MMLMTMSQQLRRIYLLFLSILLLMQSTTSNNGILLRAKECTTDADCEVLYRAGSICLLPSGKCSNPFSSGCLNTIHPEKEEYRIRECNSDDNNKKEEEEDEDPNCRISPFHYPEIRIDNQDWDVAVFFSWICQIFLSEILHVPATVGVGEAKELSSFYSDSLTLPNADSSTYSWDAIRSANKAGGNCKGIEKDCVHFIPDVWLGQRQRWEQEYNDGQLDYLDGNGQVGKTSWYIPLFTALRHPFALTYLGLTDNRQQLAEIFKRPTTWIDYCQDVSTTNCSVPDEYASRYPESKSEQSKYYYPDGYTGYFRDTAKNNCTGAENSQTCTGHIVNAKCSWSPFLEQQAYWNDIALESDGPDSINGGYAYDDVLDIWRAANATQSDVIMWWFEPEYLVEEFHNSDFAFTQVLLPTASLECREARVGLDDRCSTNVILRRGSKEGACDENAQVTKKAIAISLRDMTFKERDVDRSPAYDFIRSFNMDELEVSHLLRDFVQSGRTGYAAREVVCKWVANNTDHLYSFVPPSYPRTLRAQNNRAELPFFTALGWGIFAVLYVLVVAFEMHKRRNKKVFVYAQVQFIYAVLFGFLLVAIGSILYVVQPNRSVCLSQFWLVTLGFTMGMVPLIIKVDALNQLMRASRHMRRVVIKPAALYAKIAALLLLVTIYLIVWSVVDPPQPTTRHILSEDRNTVYTQVGCLSRSRAWMTVYYLWEGLLVLVAIVLAFQSRKAKAEFNESKSLGLLIYSHFVFSMVRVAIFYVYDDDIYTAYAATSFLLSVDVIIGVSIYLLPKFRQCHKVELRSQRSNMRGSNAVLDIQQRAAQRRMPGWQRFRRQQSRLDNRQDTEVTNDSPVVVEDSPDPASQSIQPKESVKRREPATEDAIQNEKPSTPLRVDDEDDDDGSIELISFAKGNSSRKIHGSSVRFDGWMSGSTRRSPMSTRASVTNNISKLGMESLRLLFGPTAELESIASDRNFESEEVLSDLDGASESVEHEDDTNANAEAAASAVSNEKSPSEADDESNSGNLSDDGGVLKA
eukprot:scaffold3448_cov92-Cylindrotheca_fusiformis.AAC.1